MTKDKVVIEQYNQDSSLCCIIDYDAETKTTIGTTNIICERALAFKKYEVVGEVIEGKVEFYSIDDESEYEEFDYNLYAGVEDED